MYFKHHFLSKIRSCGTSLWSLKSGESRFWQNFAQLEDQVTISSYKNLSPKIITWEIYIFTCDQKMPVLLPSLQNKIPKSYWCLFWLLFLGTISGSTLRVFYDNSFENAIRSKVRSKEPRIYRSWKTERQCERSRWAQLSELHLEHARRFLYGFAPRRQSSNMNFPLGFNLTAKFTCNTISHWSDLEGKSKHHILERKEEKHTVVFPNPW